MSSRGGQRAPGPRGLDAWRAMRHFLRDPLEYLIDLRRYGEIVRTAAGPIVFHTLYDPRALRYVFVDHSDSFTKRGVLDELEPVLGGGLLTAEGKQWQTRRSALGPGLTRRALATLVPAMDDVIMALVGRWERTDTVDASRDMMHLALSIVGRCLFDVNLGDRAPDISWAVEQVSRLALRRSRSIVKMPLAVPTPTNRAYRRSIEVLRGLVNDVIREAGRRSPFMQRLDEATGSDRDALRDEVMTFMLAGHETTATTLSWALAHLARDGGLQERARAEARSVQDGGEPTAYGLSELPVIDAVVAETLRLYPPGWMLMRRAKRAVEVLGYAVPRRCFVVAPVHALHRHPDHWTAPDRFDPDRFLEGRVPADPLLYLPFGAGSRRCIGETFARIEMRLLLVRVLDRFRLAPVGAQPAPQALTTLRPSEPVRLKLERDVPRPLPSNMAAPIRRPDA